MNNEMQPIEERLRGQLLEVIEQAQNRAFNEYRTMMDTNHSAEPSVDSGYLSTHSRPGPSRNSKGKGPANSFPADSLILSEADSNDIHRSPEMLSSPFMGRDSIASFESMSPTQQSFASMSSPEHLQFQGAMSHEIIPPEGLFSSDPSLLDYPPGDLIANMMDMDSLSWDFPLPENSSSNYTI